MPMLADTLQEQGRLPEAIAAYEVALRDDDADAAAWYGLGCAHLTQKSYGAAAIALRRAAALAPKSAAAHYNLGKAVFELGHVDRAISHFERAARLDPDVAPLARGSIACIIPGNDQANHAAVLRARRNWAQVARAPVAAVKPCATPGGKLRIGYLSAFFGARNWMKPVFALINRHDRGAFEVHMFCDGTPPAAESGYRDQDCDVIHDITGVANEQAAGIIRDSGLDVLVDLNGYSFPSRLPVLLQRPAPCIVGWFNMFATTGMAQFDWIVGDAAVIRPSEEIHYVERIHRVGGTYLAFEFLYPVPAVASPPCAATGHLTFGCLGSHYKITDAVLSAWAEILRAVPDTRLFVKNGTLEDMSVRDELLARLQVRGVDASRVTLEGRSEHFAFLEAYRHVDIALDTFPYNGGTTTTEALWQGVPVLTFDGDRWASRTSKSILLAAGLAAWVLPSRSGYIRSAISLATDPATQAMLAVLRRDLRAVLRRSAACDADRLCGEMELFYRSVAVGR